LIKFIRNKTERTKVIQVKIDEEDKKTAIEEEKRKKEEDAYLEFVKAIEDKVEIEKDKAFVIKEMLMREK